MQKIKLKQKVFKRNTEAARSLRKSLQKRLTTYNVSRINNHGRRHYIFGYYNGKKLIAGLCAYHGFVFYIDLLWVDKAYRQQGLGTKLLKMAEECGYKNGALYVRVNTVSFQAPRFYLKNGYKQFAKLPLAANDKSKQYDYYLVKYLK